MPRVLATGLARRSISSTTRRRALHAADERVGFDAGGDVLQAVLEDGLGEDRRGGGAVTGVIGGLAGGFLDQLGAHVLDLVASSISSATVTPSLVTVGPPQLLSITALRPRGPRVLFTAVASFSTPERRDFRASVSKDNSFTGMASSTPEIHAGRGVGRSEPGGSAGDLNGDPQAARGGHRGPGRQIAGRTEGRTRTAPKRGGGCLVAGLDGWISPSMPAVGHQAGSTALAGFQRGIPGQGCGVGNDAAPPATSPERARHATRNDRSAMAAAMLAADSSIPVRSHRTGYQILIPVLLSEQGKRRPERIGDQVERADEHERRRREAEDPDGLEITDHGGDQLDADREQERRSRLDRGSGLAVGQGSPARPSRARRRARGRCRSSRPIA